MEAAAIDAPLVSAAQAARVSMYCYGLDGQLRGELRGVAR